MGIIDTGFNISEKDEARQFFNKLRQNFIDWNYSEWESEDFKNIEKKLTKLIDGVKENV